MKHEVNTKLIISALIMVILIALSFFALHKYLDAKIEVMVNDCETKRMLVEKWDGKFSLVTLT